MDFANSNPVETYGLQYSLCVFEGLRAYSTVDQKTCVFALESHCQRLRQSAQTLGLQPPSVSEIMENIVQHVQSTGARDLYIRPVFYSSDIYHAFRYPSRQGILKIFSVPSQQDFSLQAGIRVCPVMYDIDFKDIHLKHAKASFKYANLMKWALKIRDAGYDNAILMDQNSNIMEGLFQNLFFVDGKILITPHSDHVFPGITRQFVIAHAERIGLEIRQEKNLRIQDIRACDEAFISSTKGLFRNIAAIHDPENRWESISFTKTEIVTRLTRLYRESIDTGSFSGTLRI